MTTTKILVVDNYDSFVYTLVGYLQELGAETTVVRNDDVTLAEAIEMAGTREGVLISPGPGNPAEAGVCIELIRWCGDNNKPMFGVCLGHQALAEAYGGKVTHAPRNQRFRGTPLPRHRYPVPFAGRSPGHHPGRPGDHRGNLQRRGHGPAAQDGTAVRRAVPPGVCFDRRRLPNAGQLA
jgi:CheY-like chemotaxis protein